MQPQFDAWCQGFRDQFTNVSIAERYQSMSNADLVDFLTPVTKEINAEVKRQHAVTRAAQIPDEIKKLHQQRSEPGNQNPETLAAIDSSIKRLQDALANLQVSDKVVRTVVDLVDQNKLSYAFAMHWAVQFPRHWGLTHENVCTAFRGESRNKPAPFDNEEYEAILHYVTNGITFEKKLGQQKDIARAFLAENAAKSGVTTTASGLQYSLISPAAVDTAVRPTDKSRIVYHARGGRHRSRPSFSTGGMDADDEPTFGSDRSPFSDRVIDLIDGLREGVKRMRVGETYRFWIEARLAWGDKFAFGGLFYPHDLLLLELKLIDVEDLSDDELAASYSGTTNDQCDGDKCERGALTLRSAAFKDGEALPGRYTCEGGRGGGYSPPLSWTGASEHVKSFVLVVTKGADAAETLSKTTSPVYWLVYDIPSNVTSLNSGTLVPAGAKFGVTLHGDRAFYVSPCGTSESESDTYLFNLFALKVESVGTQRDLRLSAIARSIEEHTLQSAQIRATVRKGDGGRDMFRRSLHKSIDKLPAFTM